VNRRGVATAEDLKGMRMEKTPKYAWVVLSVVFLASVVAPLNQFKVPPAAPELIRQFGLDMTMIGLLMSVFAIAGFFLALPAGFVLARLGIKTTGILSIATIILGSLWGTYATNTSMLLVSRIVEGIGLAVIGVMAPVAISMWFPARVRGLALGIWSTWFSVGIILMLNVSPVILGGGTWRGIWWFGTVFAAVALVLFLFFYRDPSSEMAEATGGPPGSGGQADGAGRLLSRTLAIGDVWLVSTALLAFNIVILGMGTFLPMFLVTQHSLDMQAAGFYTSIPNIVMLVSCPLGGWLSDKLGSKKFLIAVCLVLVSLWWIVAFRLPLQLIPFSLVLYGLVGGPVITAVLSVLPDVVKKPELMGFGMAVLMLFNNAGQFIGPALFGKVLDAAGWNVAAYVMVPVCLGGAVCSLLIKVKR
jgi:MFS family permease